MASHSSGSQSATPWVISGLILVTLCGAIYAFPRMGGNANERVDQAMLYKVVKDDLLVTVTEEGNVESAINIDIKCQVAGGTSILWIVEDGKQVKEGEKLVEFDSSALEEQINTQKIAFEKARATKLQSEKNVAVAEISVKEYLEGTYQQSMQDAEALIKIAEENLRSSKNSLEHTERMFRKGYVSELDLEAAKFSVERAKLELGSAETARDVLVKFTKEKTLEDLRSQRDNAAAQMRSDTSAFELEEIRLKRLEDQMENCTVYAPQAGMVVFANERGGRFGQSQATIEEGATVRERQTILRLPDLSKMQVKVNVHESKVDQIDAGMRARVRILDNQFRGTVTSIANQPEPSSFFTGNVKEYATYVRISEDEVGGDNLRPGMTAEVEILVAHLTDVPVLPVAAVVEQRGGYFAWVTDGESKPEKREVLLGVTNDKFVEVKDGVAVGDTALLNPRAIVDEARKLGEEENLDVNKRFGEVRPAGPSATRERSGGGGPGAPGTRRPGGPSGGGPGGGSGGPPNFDKDGDGKISRDEAPERMKSFFDRIDANGDGFLDKSEMSKMRRPGAGGQPGGGSPGGGPPGGGAPGGRPGQP